MTARTIIVPGRGAAHDYDELIDALATFLQALIQQRFRDQSKRAPGIRTIGDDLREIRGEVECETPDDAPLDPIAERRAEREAFHVKRQRKPMSQEQRDKIAAKMRAIHASKRGAKS